METLNTITFFELGLRLTNSLKKTLRGETHQLKHVIETRYRANGTQFGE